MPTFDPGLTSAQFRQQYLEKRPLLRRAVTPGVHFAWSELDRVLHQIEPCAPGFQLFDNGPLPEQAFTHEVPEFGVLRRRLNKRAFYAALHRGATLVINRLENHSPIAERLCLEVARFSASRTMGNAYLSRGGRGTFGAHWDTHDVFALQLIGRKRWQVYEPTLVLPLPVHRSEDSQAACPGEPLLDCVLDAGDMLYVPRGWWHRVIPLDGPSLHLSVGTYLPTVHDLVMWACTRHLPALLTARRSLHGRVRREDVTAVVQHLEVVLRDESVTASFTQDLAAGERAASPFNTALFLESGPCGLHAGAVVTLSIRIPPDDNGVVVVNGASLSLGSVSREVIGLLAASPTMSMSAIHAGLPHRRVEEIRIAVLDLAQHELVAIDEN